MKHIVITGHIRERRKLRTLTELELYTELLPNWNSTQNSYRIGTLHRTLTELEL